jgi:hypothetical protein
MKKLTMIIMLAVAIVGTAQSAVTVNMPEAGLRKATIIIMTGFGDTLVNESEHSLTLDIAGIRVAISKSREPSCLRFRAK